MRKFMIIKPFPLNEAGDIIKTNEKIFAVNHKTQTTLTYEQACDEGWLLEITIK